jgi:predicted nucleic acid-binding protein
MTPFVVDASFTMSWCFFDEATPFTNSVLDAFENTYAVVPALWPFEIASALAVAVRRQRISPDDVAAFLEKLRHLPIQIERRDAFGLCQTVLPLAPEYRLSAYDAAYLELARRERVPLATLDSDLQQAARALGVPLVEPVPER